jgi:mannose-6-phosphate isomerase class I
MDKAGLWKLSPEVVTKPWGLRHAEAYRLTGIEVGAGEFWLASAQTGPGNYSNEVSEPALRRSLADLLDEAAGAGDSALRELLGPNAVAHLRANPHRGKTEAWYIRDAEGRCGVAAGPANKREAERLQHLISVRGLEPDIDAWTPEVRRLFGLIEPLKGGEMFLAPAGALHTMFAVGPESRLIIDEIQQGYGEAKLPTLTKILMVQDNLLSVQVHPDDATVAAAANGTIQVDQDLDANPTVRVYDFGRRPGEYPELGFKLVNPDAGLRLVTPVTIEPEWGQQFEVMVADPHFIKHRHTLTGVGPYGLGPRYGSYRVLHCLSGSAELMGGNRAMSVTQGNTVFVPACLEDELRIVPEEDCAFFDDAFPDLPFLMRYLGTNGADADKIEALLSSPRAERTHE